jgi:hypothetical protein
LKKDINAGTNMEKIILEKGKGKTTELIKRSSESGHYIVCFSIDEASRISAEARSMGLDIPLPISYGEFIYRKYSSRNIKGFLIDNADLLIEFISQVPVTAITMTP